MRKIAAGLNKPNTILGFDYGIKKIGVAIGQDVTHTAEPLATLYSKNLKPDWDSIGQIIKDWRPTMLLVGLPLNGLEHDQNITQAARRFANKLKGRYQLPVFMFDEHLSTQEARSQANATLTPNGNKHGLRPYDGIAAQLILQSWLNQRNTPSHEC